MSLEASTIVKALQTINPEHAAMSGEELLMEFEDRKTPSKELNILIVLFLKTLPKLTQVPLLDLANKLEKNSDFNDVASCVKMGEGRNTLLRKIQKFLVEMAELDMHLSHLPEQLKDRMLDKSELDMVRRGIKILVQQRLGEAVNQSVGQRTTESDFGTTEQFG